MADEALGTRVARLEERTNSLEEWRDVLRQDVKDTKSILAEMDGKLDRAILTSSKSLPRWADLAIVILVGLLGAAAAIISTGHW